MESVSYMRRPTIWYLQLFCERFASTFWIAFVSQVGKNSLIECILKWGYSRRYREANPWWGSSLQNWLAGYNGYLPLMLESNETVTDSVNLCLDVGITCTGNLAVFTESLFCVGVFKTWQENYFLMQWLILRLLGCLACLWSLAFSITWIGWSGNRFFNFITIWPFPLQVW